MGFPIIHATLVVWLVRLLNLNVRSFLQLGTKINKGIKETLINEPERFFSYNNGIVVVVDSIEVGQDKEGSFLKSASGFQIVNGGQTTATLFRTKKQNNKVNFYKFFDHSDSLFVPSTIFGAYFSIASSPGFSELEIFLRNWPPSKSV